MAKSSKKSRRPKANKAVRSAEALISRLAGSAVKPRKSSAKKGSAKKSSAKKTRKNPVRKAATRRPAAKRRTVRKSTKRTTRRNPSHSGKSLFAPRPAGWALKYTRPAKKSSKR